MSAVLAMKSSPFRIRIVKRYLKQTIKVKTQIQLEHIEKVTVNIMQQLKCCVCTKVSPQSLL